jgi:uncharacterized C2H2 Zn-finger protein
MPRGYARPAGDEKVYIPGMKWLVPLIALVLAGCGGQARHAGTPAAAAANEIQELTNQTLIYECPKCGMMFSAAGTCAMDGDSLVATRVDYVCPADQKPVAHAGQCPRCAMHARVEKTAVAAGQPPPTP